MNFRKRNKQFCVSEYCNWETVYEVLQSDLTYPHTVRPHLSTHSQTSLIHTQSDLTYPHTSVLDEIADKMRKLDTQGSSSIVYSRIIADLF